MICQGRAAKRSPHACWRGRLQPIAGHSISFDSQSCTLTGFDRGLTAGKFTAGKTAVLHLKSSIASFDRRLSGAKQTWRCTCHGVSSLSSAVTGDWLSSRYY